MPFDTEKKDSTSTGRFVVQNQDGAFVSMQGAATARDMKDADIFDDEKEAKAFTAQLMKRAGKGPSGNAFGPMGGSGVRASYKVVPVEESSDFTMKAPTLKDVGKPSSPEDDQLNKLVKKYKGFMDWDTSTASFPDPDTAHTFQQDFKKTGGKSGNASSTGRGWEIELDHGKWKNEDKSAWQEAKDAIEPEEEPVSESAWNTAQKLVECPVQEAQLQEDHATKAFNELGLKLSDMWRKHNDMFDKSDLKIVQKMAEIIDRFDPKEGGDKRLAPLYGKLVGSWRHLLEDLVAAGSIEPEGGE